MFLEAYSGCPHSLLSRVPPDLLARTLEQLQHVPDQVLRCLAEMPCLLDGCCIALLSSRIGQCVPVRDLSMP